MPRKLSLKTLHGASHAHALEYVQRVQPTAFVVMADQDLAKAVYDASRDWEMLVIFRPPGDDADYMNANAQQFVQHWHDVLNQRGMPDAALYWLNEMSIHPDKPAQLMAGMRTGVQLERRMVVGNDATGNPPGHPAQAWIDYYGAQIQYANEHADLITYAAHEYAPHPDEPSIPWRLGRFEFFFQACEELDAHDLKLLVTEFGIGTGDDKGYRDFDLSGEQYAQWVLEHSAIYQDNPRVLACCVYGLGPGFGWDGFNVDDPAYLDYLYAHLPPEVEEPPAPPEEPDPPQPPPDEPGDPPPGDLEARIAANEAAIQALTNRVAGLEEAYQDVPALRQEVETLIAWKADAEPVLNALRVQYGRMIEGDQLLAATIASAIDVWRAGREEADYAGEDEALAG